jgi:hypothetical protein
LTESRTKFGLEPCSTMVIIFLIGFGIRLFMPVYLLISGSRNYLSLMAYSSQYHIWNYINDFVNRGEFPKTATLYYIPYASLCSLPVKFSNFFSIRNLDIVSVQIMQAGIDCLGCLLIYKILAGRFSPRVGIIGAILYAIWPASIFYSYHIIAECYTPILILAICYSIMEAVEKSKYIWFFAAGLACGGLVLLRPDNFFVIPGISIFLFWVYWKERWKKIHLILVLLFSFGISYGVASKGVQWISRSSIVPMGNYSAAVGFYNSLGEYPGTMRGLRFYDDGVSLQHIQEREKKYKEMNDPIYLVLYRSIDKYYPGLPVYIREIILGRPILYFDSLIRRFIAYLPGHPFCAYICYFLSKFPDLNGWNSMIDYRYSQIFHAVKYFDYFLFCLFILGLWRVRRDKVMMSLCGIYLSVLIGHVLTSIGEVYFRVGASGLDTETAFANPAYLLGMVSVWPIFIPLGIMSLKEKILKCCKYPRRDRMIKD